MKLTERIEGLVVVLIDMHYGFLGDQNSRRIDPKIIPHQIEVLQFCRRTNTPVIVVECSWKIFGKTICPLLNIAEKIPACRYIQKDKNSAFSTLEFELYLDEFKATTLLLMGVRADACIFHTAKDAVERKKYTVITSEMLMSWYNPDKEHNRKEWYRQNTIYYSQYNTE